VSAIPGTLILRQEASPQAFAVPYTVPVTLVSHTGEYHVKKGRHRRFEEARALKRAVEITVEPCPECGAMPGAEHKSWCEWLLDNGEEDDDDEDDS